MINITTKRAIRIIKKKRKRNKKQFNDNYKKAIKLIKKGKTRKADKLTSQDVLSFVEEFNKAKSAEDKGNLEGAASLYWYNIIENGTDAPANFKRLMIVLRKLNEYEDELKVAKIYKQLYSKSRSKIIKRIKTIENKINKPG